MARRKRRSWSKEEKRSICLQTLAPGVSVAQVARRYAMNANQIFNWLKDARFAPVSENIEADAAGFIPVDVCCEPPANSVPSVLEPAKAIGSHGHIEIALSGGHRLIVEGGFDGAELARLLKGLVS
ncbi:MAG: transposase [Hyphomicrobiales bacterium]|nr:transposase [Hyphomicrobiales bacterium]